MSSRTREAIVATTLAWVVATCSLLCVVACSKKAEKTPDPATLNTTANTANTANTATNAPLEAQVAAMLRGHPHARRICIDEARENAFFLDYGPPLGPKQEPDGFAHGWLFIEKVKFHETSNNTWFITVQDESSYITVFPDVSGLDCRSQ